MKTLQRLQSRLVEAVIKSIIETIGTLLANPADDNARGEGIAAPEVPVGQKRTPTGVGARWRELLPG